MNLTHHLMHCDNARCVSHTTQCIVREMVITHLSLCCENLKGDSHSHSVYFDSSRDDSRTLLCITILRNMTITHQYVFRQFERLFTLITQCIVIIWQVTLAHHSVYCDNWKGDSCLPFNILRQLKRWHSLTIHCIATAREATLTYYWTYCDCSRSSSHSPFNVLWQLEMWLSLTPQRAATVRVTLRISAIEV